MSSFQTKINQYPAYAVEGDFASANPRVTMLPVDEITVAGTGGVTVGRFAWVTDNTVRNAGTTAPSGFVHREGQALITEYEGSASMLVPAGRPVTLCTRGDFWARTAAAATRGQKVFASTTDGSVTVGTVGATVAGYIETEFYVANDCAADELVKISTWSV